MCTDKSLNSLATVLANLVESCVQRKEVNYFSDKETTLIKSLFQGSVSSLIYKLIYFNILPYESILIGSIYFEKLILNTVCNVNYSNFDSFFLTCLAIGLKYNNDYYYIKGLFYFSNNLTEMYPHYEKQILEYLDYKVFLSLEDYENFMMIIDIDTLDNTSNQIYQKELCSKLVSSDFTTATSYEDELEGSPIIVSNFRFSSCSL